MRDQVTYRIGLAMAAGAFLAGCGATSDSPAAPATEPAPSAPGVSAPPSTGVSAGPSTGTGADPSEIPREPGDGPPATGWVSGMVTRGGTGPCYGLTADDGTKYALYGTDGVELTKGERVRVQVETTQLRIYCGPGDLMAMTASEPIK
ncbi:hypothetical protein [Actinoplanes sp. DH11]|uniref:hypothetical protein n=1 Tax=Actinoplanes sp. DH11 TaxID=2857011 RepID=UPI001E3093EE|nr:hypothetical protein [Actinoplanes sp. DH11]